MDASRFLVSTRLHSRQWSAVIEQLDLEVSTLGVTRQSIIKVWPAERLASRRDPAGTAVVEPSSS